MTTSWITNHWADKDWTTLQVHQRYAEGDQKGEFYREGPLGELKTSEFGVLKHEKTGDLLQKNSNWESLGKVAAISLLTIPSLLSTLLPISILPTPTPSFPWILPVSLTWCAPSYLALSILGNTGLPQLAEDFINGQPINLPKKDRAWEHFSSAVLKAGILYLPTLIRNKLGFEVMGYNLITTLAVVSWAGYMICNPRGAALAINAVEEKVNVKALPECNSLATNHWFTASNWRSLLTGAIPLTSLLGIHRVGNIKDKVDDKPRFTLVEEPKKDK